MTLFSRMQTFTFIMPTGKVYFECPANMKKVSDIVKTRLSNSAKLNISIQEREDECAVKMCFCPVVSRAGTDIESALARVSGDKPTIMFVLHHTFDPELNVPSSSRYERDNLVMVDIMFHEDAGLLNCSKNDEAIAKAGSYLKKYAQPSNVCRCVNYICQVVMDKRAWVMAASVVFFFYVYRHSVKRRYFFKQRVFFIKT